MKHFEAIHEVPVPDQWDGITARARATDPPPGPGPTGIAQPARRRLLLAAAVVLTLVAVLSTAGRDDGPTTVTVEAPPNQVAPQPRPVTGREAMVVECPDGAIASEAIPSGASEASTLTSSDLGGRHVRSWSAGDLRFELLIPGLDYVDFVGERTDVVQDPPGRLMFHADETRFQGPTGLAGPCDTYELAASGGAEEQRSTALLQIAAGLAFDPSRGVADCGELNPAPLHVVEGPNAMAAVRDLAIPEIVIGPRSPGDPLPQIRYRPDGRCEITVAGPGGLRPVATISGRDGRYGLDHLRGFAPDGFSDTTGTVQMEVPASISIQGRQVWVDVDYWCDDCTEATMTLHYPADDLTATVSTSGPGPFAGRLDRPSTPNSYGWIAITWWSPSEGRGIWTTSIASGDFAAG